MTLFRVLTVRLWVRVNLLFKRQITPESPLLKHFALMLGASLGCRYCFGFGVINRSILATCLSDYYLVSSI